MTSAGKATLVASAVVALPLAGLVAWRVARPHGPSASPHVAVVVDRSESALSACEAAGGLVARALDAPGLSRHSALIVLATGDDATLNEPVEVERLAGFKTSRAMESPGASERRRRDLVIDAVVRCRSLRRPSTTAVFLASKRAAEQLRALGCREGTGCMLLIQTDGEENAEPGIRRALGGSRATAHLPAPIDNVGIATVVCGFAETAGPTDRPAHARVGRSARSADRLREIWHSLFAAPDLVTFEPVCPKADASPPDQPGPESKVAGMRR